MIDLMIFLIGYLLTGCFIGITIAKVTTDPFQWKWFMVMILWPFLIFIINDLIHEDSK